MADTSLSAEEQRQIEKERRTRRRSPTPSRGSSPAGSRRRARCRSRRWAEGHPAAEGGRAGLLEAVGLGRAAARGGAARQRRHARRRRGREDEEEDGQLRRKRRRHDLRRHLLPHQPPRHPGVQGAAEGEVLPRVHIVYGKGKEEKKGTRAGAHPGGAEVHRPLGGRPPRDVRVVRRRRAAGRPSSAAPVPRRALAPRHPRPRPRPAPLRRVHGEGREPTASTTAVLRACSGMDDAPTEKLAIFAIYDVDRSTLSLGEMTQIFVKGEPSSAQQRIIERTERMWAEIRMRRGARAATGSRCRRRRITKGHPRVLRRVGLDQILLRVGARPREAEAAGVGRRLHPRLAAMQAEQERARARRQEAAAAAFASRSARTLGGARRRCSEAGSERRRARSAGWGCRRGRCGRRRRRRRCRAARAAT